MNQALPKKRRPSAQRDPERKTLRNLRRNLRRSSARALADLRIADRIIDQLNAQWRAQFEAENISVVTDTTPAKPISLAQSKGRAWPGNSDPAAFVRAKAGPRVGDLFRLVERRELQDAEDARVAASPVYMPDGKRLALRATAAK